MAEPIVTEPSLPTELPVVPLRRAVVFPMTVQPLAVNRPVSVDSINRALAADRMVLLVMQQGEDDDPPAEALRRIGTVAVIRQMAKSPVGLQILVEGLARVRVLEYTREQTAFRARIQAAPEAVERSLEVDAYVRRVRELIDRAVSLSTGLSPELRGLLLSIDDPLRLCYLLASLLDMKADDKQLLLEQDLLTIKLNAVSSALAREISLLELKGKIESQAQQEMSDAQRQYYLRQQLKAIQDELGENEGRDTQDLQQRVEAASLPEHVLAAVTRELDRLERMPQASPEHQMIRTYIEWILEIPWNVVTEDRLDPVEARRALDEDHYDLDKVKERIVEYLAVRKLKGDLKGPILCFAGPPGVGKTSLGQSIARAMNRKFVRISLGGVRDEAEVRGHRRTYIGAIPGRIVQAMKQAGSINPVFMLDEIDKVMAGGFSGDPAAALLEVLDPAQNHSFRDHYLEVALDLSRVLFIATANQLGPVHPALLDRMEVISLVGYTEEDKLHIARRYLIPRQLSEHGLTTADIAIEDAAISRIVAEYTREAGVRTLERQIGAVARKVAARVAMTNEPREVPAAVGGGEAPPRPRHTVSVDDLPDYLGPPRFKSDVAIRTSRPGVATGVAWTETGGEVLFIEASLLPAGKGQIILTGQLGNVMQESARAAVSHIRAQAERLAVSADFLEIHDLHVHVPAGAIPKDGPSAGVTMATAILSALRRVAVREDVAMTGEITLSGLVLPVGGIREKALAARRHGIHTFVLPERNTPDLAELPEDLKRDMTFVPAATLDDVLRVALPADA
ncbi:MAG: endopeptidase La [Acidobacteria bacterium]|nr:endopeptidase La [Acidobacteriota bacterium]